MAFWLDVRWGFWDGSTANTCMLRETYIEKKGMNSNEEEKTKKGSLSIYGPFLLNSLCPTPCVGAYSCTLAPVPFYRFFVFVFVFDNNTLFMLSTHLHLRKIRSSFVGC